MPCICLVSVTLTSPLFNSAARNEILEPKGGQDFDDLSKEEEEP